MGVNYSAEGHHSTFGDATFWARVGAQISEPIGSTAMIPVAPARAAPLDQKSVLLGQATLIIYTHSIQHKQQQLQQQQNKIVPTLKAWNVFYLTSLCSANDGQGQTLESMDRDRLEPLSPSGVSSDFESTYSTSG